MPIFRKKPVCIEARQWDGSLAEAHVIQEWSNVATVGTSPDGVRLEIATLEGIHKASPGDWIIRGVKGEFYPCKPDIFSATYDPVS